MMMGCRHRRQKRRRQRHTESRRPSEDGGRDWNYTVPSQGKPRVLAATSSAGQQLSVVLSFQLVVICYCSPRKLTKSLCDLALVYLSSLCPCTCLPFPHSHVVLWFCFCTCCSPCLENSYISFFLVEFHFTLRLLSEGKLLGEPLFLSWENEQTAAP